MAGRPRKIHTHTIIIHTLEVWISTTNLAIE